MENHLVETSPRSRHAVSTPEGEQALRQLGHSAALSCVDADEDQARGLISQKTRDLLPLALNEARALLAPAQPKHFQNILSPTLALVAPAGMSEEDQTAWLVTAHETLTGIPADLLERGCRSARQKVDHPSKIVRAIFAEVQTAWDLRRAQAAKIERLDRLAQLPPPAEQELVDPREVAKLLGSIGAPVEKASRPEPTKADYLALGLTEREAEETLGERRKMLAGMAQQIGKAAA